jgi:hypothetical protein
MSDDFDESVFQGAMKEAGMTTRARVKSGGATVDIDLTDWMTPDTVLANGALSKQYEMEYVATDLPKLKEGDAVTLLDAAGVPLTKQKYQVRQPPTVTDQPGESRTGFFKLAVLTKL